MTIHIDGIDGYGCHAGDAEKGPFYLFDDEKQEDVAGPFATRDEAIRARDERLRRENMSQNAQGGSK